MERNPKRSSVRRWCWAMSAALLFSVACLPTKLRAEELETSKLEETLLAEVTIFYVKEADLPKLGFTDRTTSATPERELDFNLGERLDEMKRDGLLRNFQELGKFRITENSPFEFGVGGEIPVISALPNGGISVQYKNFGDRLQISGNELGVDKIRLTVVANRIDLDETHEVTVGENKFPGLKSLSVTFKVDVKRNENVLFYLGHLRAFGDDQHLCAVVKPR